jgi:uncharacterized OsmC-like protein
METRDHQYFEYQRTQATSKKALLPIIMILAGILACSGVALYYYLPHEPADRFNPTASPSTDTNTPQGLSFYSVPSFTPRSTDTTQKAAYYVKVTGTKTIEYADTKGNKVNAFEHEAKLKELQNKYENKNDINPLDLLALQSVMSGIPNASQNKVGENAMEIVFPAQEEFSLTIGPDPNPTDIEIFYGNGSREGALFALRYRGITLQNNQKAQIKLSAEGIVALAADTAGNSNYVYILKPLSAVYDAQAADIEGPQIGFTKFSQQDGEYAEVLAVDPAGVKKVYISTDGKNYTEYTNPMKTQGITQIFVVAEDTIGNRSAQSFGTQ